jgi:hypothetical protein
MVPNGVKRPSNLEATVSLLYSSVPHSLVSCFVVRCCSNFQDFDFDSRPGTRDTNGSKQLLCTVRGGVFLVLALVHEFPTALQANWKVAL